MSAQVHVGGKIWKYRVGRSNVVINSPEGKRITVNHSELTGRTWDTIERGQWKRTQDGMILPCHVKEYVERYISFDGKPPRHPALLMQESFSREKREAALQTLLDS
jgi:hypothetical protein